MTVDDKIGLILIDLTGFDDREKVDDLVTNAVSRLPFGRVLIAMWCVDGTWSPQVPIEAWVTSAAIGSPTQRTDSSLEFFGNGAVRTYRTKSVVPESSWNWLCFRRPGEKTYRRRLNAEPDVIRQSKIETLLPVFTRDAANNVWHMTHKDSKKMIRERFQVLLTWSDEWTIEIRPGRNLRFGRPQVSFSEGLIGSASKTIYEWDALPSPRLDF
jgi:hypothetical protein